MGISCARCFLPVVLRFVPEQAFQLGTILVFQVITKTKQKTCHICKVGLPSTQTY